MSAFQWIFDNAESISIDKRPVVAQTITRSNVVRSISYGGPLWRFEVKYPDGPRWSDIRSNIEEAEALGEHTSATVQINHSGYNDWLTSYLGDSVNYTDFQANWTLGSNTLTLTTSPSTPSGFKFKSGDIIQLDSNGHVYTASADTAFDSNTVTLNKPVIDATGSGNLFVANNVTWTVICTNFPKWTIFARDQVSWDGPFVFYEVI